MTDETKKVYLRDLRNLGKQGGATARLEDGTELFLKPDYIEASLIKFVPSRKTVT